MSAAHLVFLFATNDGKAAELCPPSATIRGARELVTPIESELGDRGVSTTPPSGCPTVRARVERRPEGVSVEILDRYGRSSERTVTNPKTAAAVIETWVRNDLSDPLLAARPFNSPSSNEPSPPGDSKEVPDRISGISPPWAALLGLAGDVGGGFDGSFWFGGRLSGCFMLGPICLGAAAIFRADPGLGGDSHRMETERIGVNGFLMADWPLRWGSIILAPGIGLGFGWMRSAGEIDAFVRGDVENETEFGEEEIEEDEEEEEEARSQRVEKRGESLGLPLHVELIAGLQVTRRLFITAGLSLDVVLLAHTDPFTFDSGEIAGEPQAYVTGSLGLGFGVP